mmetsp:Transcript_4335/g.12756  ORF Transcript_4335/g.12756 Transcript_4335/m.12756 type:complete len:131 (+) Transcript_4335:807-1199(+)
MTLDASKNFSKFKGDASDCPHDLSVANALLIGARGLSPPEIPLPMTPPRPPTQTALLPRASVVPLNIFRDFDDMLLTSAKWVAIVVGELRCLGCSGAQIDPQSTLSLGKGAGVTSYQAGRPRRTVLSLKG